MELLKFKVIKGNRQIRKGDIFTVEGVYKQSYLMSAIKRIIRLITF
jgi:hypothetical protein